MSDVTARLIAVYKNNRPRANGGELIEMGTIARLRSLRSASDSRITVSMWTGWGQNQDNSASTTRSQTPDLQTIISAVFARLLELQVRP